MAQKTGIRKWNPGKWKHGPKPAVCPSCLILSHTHMKPTVKNMSDKMPEEVEWQVSASMLHADYSNPRNWYCRSSVEGPAQISTRGKDRPFLRVLGWFALFFFSPAVCVLRGTWTSSKPQTHGPLLFQCRGSAFCDWPPPTSGSVCKWNHKPEESSQPFLVLSALGEKVASDGDQSTC